jgi:hypothetical protein
VDRPKLEEELAHEIERVRTDYPEEWKFFGDITPATVLKHVGSRKEPPWFKAEWPDGSVATVAGLAAAFGYKWEYDFLYDVFSALVHSRGIKQDITIEGNTVSAHLSARPRVVSNARVFHLGLASDVPDDCCEMERA